VVLDTVGEVDVEGFALFSTVGDVEGPTLREGANEEDEGPKLTEGEEDAEGSAVGAKLKPVS